MKKTAIVPLNSICLTFLVLVVLTGTIFAQSGKPAPKNSTTKIVPKAEPKEKVLKIKSYNLQRLSEPESMDANFEYDTKGRIIKYTEVWKGEKNIDWKNRSIELSYDDPRYIFQKVHESPKEKYYLYVLNPMGYIEKVFRGISPQEFEYYKQWEKLTHNGIVFIRDPQNHEFDNGEIDFRYNLEGYLIQAPLVTLNKNLNGIRKYEISNGNIVNITSKFKGYRGDFETISEKQTYSDEVINPYMYYIHAIINDFAQCPFGNGLYFNFLIPEKYGKHSKNVWTGPRSEYNSFTGRERPLLEGSASNSFCNVTHDYKASKSFVDCNDPGPKPGDYTFNFKMIIQHQEMEIIP